MDIIYTIWLRSMIRFMRSKSRIIGSISMPIFFLLFLGFGLNSVVRIPGLSENYTKRHNLFCIKILIHRSVQPNHQTSIPKHHLGVLLLENIDCGLQNIEKLSKLTQLDLVLDCMGVKRITQFFVCFLRARVGS